MKELIITPPEGYEIDKEKSTLERIVFKPIDTKPRSWEEFCKNRKGDVYYSSQNDGSIHKLTIPKNFCNPYTTHHLLPSKELAEAFLAMMQLMSLRQAWIGDWKPNWKDSKQQKHVIRYENGSLTTCWSFINSHPLSFPTSKMTAEFFNCFKDLLEQAKILL